MPITLCCCEWPNSKHCGSQTQSWSALHRPSLPRLRMTGEDHLQLRRVRQHLRSVHTTGPGWGALEIFLLTFVDGIYGISMDRLENEDKFIVWVCMGMYWYVFLFVWNYGQTSKKLDVFFGWASTISHTVALKSRSPMESRQLLDKETSICSTIGLRLRERRGWAAIPSTSWGLLCIMFVGWFKTDELI